MPNSAAAPSAIGQPRGPFLSNQIASLLSSSQHEKSSSKPILNEKPGTLDSSHYTSHVALTPDGGKDVFFERPGGQQNGTYGSNPRPDHNTLKTFTPRNGTHTSSNPALNKYPLECSGTTNIMGGNDESMRSPSVTSHQVALSGERRPSEGMQSRADTQMQSFGCTNQNGVPSSFSNEKRTNGRPSAANNSKSSKRNSNEEPSSTSKFV